MPARLLVGPSLNSRWSVGKLPGKIATLLSISVGLALATAATPGFAAPPSATLGRIGALIGQDTFDAAEPAKPWVRNTGAWKIEGGSLALSELKADNHAAAIRYLHPLQDAVVQVKFTLDGTQMFNLGFDPAKGELKKTGHLFAVAFTNGGYVLRVDRDKSNDADKGQILAQGKLELTSGEPHELVLEMKGPDVKIHLDGKLLCQGSHPTLAVKKPGVVFRTSGPNDAATLLHEVAVYTLE